MLLMLLLRTVSKNWCKKTTAVLYTVSHSECEWFNYNNACRCPANRKMCAIAICSAAHGSRLGGGGQLPPLPPLATPLPASKERNIKQATVLR